MTKRKKVIKKTERHWTAFDEPINGPTKLATMMDSFMDDVIHGEAITLADLRVKNRITPTQWDNMVKKYPGFKESLELVKDAIYARRHKLVAFEDKSPILLKDAYRYSKADIQQDYDITQMGKEADHVRKKELLRLQAELNKDTIDRPTGDVHIIIDGMSYSSKDDDNPQPYVAVDE